MKIVNISNSIYSFLKTTTAKVLNPVTLSEKTSFV